ncbi:M20 family metallo-hydrolase [Treponema brennaborense]|uniref:Acetylornithine deacetylase or succinyl-diaminopimelate desuccinylase n=1 Tax=Treponema brennaborense (strain DSM 12168 / CIP 105900 / DD5/3) TaxID=906968 RepID=F4LPI7_TREBD|nr:M20 family metallo-hydrolase [Treponema brennaborense]AEE15998.1 acetylornithine deacetylase or succinyl-diaminopimelate desuccinylase [Treponema brennaborense DSM 12168]
MASAFDRVTDFIAASRSDMIELETLLTSFPALAPENGGQGELEKVTALESWLMAHGVTRLERFDAPDSRVSSGIRPNLIATIPGADDSVRVWIMAHTDVVPVGELSLWRTDPWKVVEKDGKLYGRGVEDNQQGLVAGIFAALSLLKNGITPAHTVKLLFVADEEVGSDYGIKYLLQTQKLFKSEDIIIIPDGGDSQGATIEVAEKNLLWMRVSVHGKQTHGSRPDEGVNAALAGCDLALRLNALETVFDKRDELFEPPYSTFQPTKKEANVPNINTIPGEDVFCMDCRILPCYSLAQVRAEIGACIAAVEKKYGVTVSYTEPQAVESPATPADAPVAVKLAAAIKAVTGVSARPIGIGGGTVGAYLRNAGLNAVVWSRMDETAHQPNEYTVLDNLANDALVLAYVMMNS